MTTNKPNTNKPAQAEDLLLSLLAEAVSESARKTSQARRTSQAQGEVLAQELTPRDVAALERMGWTGRLSSPKPNSPQRGQTVKPGPLISANFASLSPETQARQIFWAGLCSTLSRSKGKIWIPEIAAVAAQMGIPLPNVSRLSNQLVAMTGCAVERPSNQAGWLVCNIHGEMPAATKWAKIWQISLQKFSDNIAAEM